MRYIFENISASKKEVIYNIRARGKNQANHYSHQSLPLMWFTTEHLLLYSAMYQILIHDSDCNQGTSLFCMCWSSLMFTAIIEL